MSKLKDKKKEVLDKVLTDKDGKRIKLGKDIKIILIVIGAGIAMLFFGFFAKSGMSVGDKADTVDANTNYLDSVLLGKQTKEMSNIDTAADKNTSKLKEFILTRVIDGDTIEVKQSENSEPFSVRLLSVNTPESVNPNPALNNDYGNRASEYTKQLLANTPKVYLSYDKQDKDEYGRTLAYVWLSPDANPNSEDDVRGYLLNSQLIQNGYAEVMIVEPNHKYKEIFEKQEKSAIEQGVGLWADNGFRQLTNKGLFMAQNTATDQPQQ